MSNVLYERAKELLLRNGSLETEDCRVALVTDTEFGDRLKEGMVAHGVMTFGIVGDITILKPETE